MTKIVFAWVLALLALALGVFLIRFADGLRGNGPIWSREEPQLPHPALVRLRRVQGTVALIIGAIMIVALLSRHG